MVHFYTLLPKMFVRPVELHSLSARKSIERECSTTSLRQGGYIPLRRLRTYFLWTCCHQTLLMIT